jgi:hemerythrin superfamily protein
MDVFKLLKQDHKLVKNLFKQLESSRPSKAREKGLQQLQQEISLHTEVEETIVYPRLREEKKLREVINEAYEEHHMATMLLEELMQTPIEEERWDAKLAVLKEMIEHHVQEEEKELFPKASKALKKDEIKALGKQVEDAKQERMAGLKKAKRAGDAEAEQRPQA